MASPKYNQKKGATFESAIVTFIRKVGHTAERLRMGGQGNDQGDIVAVIAGKTYIIEAKNVQRLDLPTFWDEAVVEAKNYAKNRGLEQVPPAYIVVKRRNASIEKAWVICPLKEWIEQCQHHTDI